MGSSERFIGLDIGGTSVKACLADEDGNMVARYATPTCPLDDELSCARFSAQLAAYVRQQRSRAVDVVAIGVAVPGPMRGLDVEMLPNATLDVPLLLERLRDEFPNAGFAYLNDANAAAYAESRRGFAADADSALLVCIGTGIGAGLVVGGRLVGGENGAAGEVGHLKVVKGGRRCGCGGSGCLEQYASARGIVRTFREVDANNPALYADLGKGRGTEIAGLRPKHGSDSQTVFSAFSAGDARARHAVETFSRTLGFALAQVACVFDPEKILLGGGVSASFELFRKQLLAAYRKSCIPPCAATPVYPAKLGVDAGAIGAALYAREHAE